MTYAGYYAHLLWALANAFVCCAICWSCNCRIRQMSSQTTLPLYRALYGIVMTMTAASAIAPWWDEWPGPGCTVSNVALLLLLLVNGRMWRYGVPPHARSDFAALDEAAPREAGEPPAPRGRVRVLAAALARLWREHRRERRTGTRGVDPTHMPSGWDR